MDDSLNGIKLNLKTDNQRENAFFLMVLLANSYIAYIRHNLTEFEHQIFCFHIRDVYKRIYHHENNWTDTYMETSKHLTQSDDIGGNVYGAIRFGLDGISKRDVENLCKLFEFSCFYLEATINRGCSQMANEAKDAYMEIMNECGILNRRYF